MQPSLFALDHKQPATPLKLENSTTEEFVKFGMKPKCSKTWDMKWHWLIDKDVLEKLRVYWDKGTKTTLIILQKITPQSTIVKCVLGIYILQI